MAASQAWLQQLPQNLVIGLQQGSIYSLLALGYTLVCTTLAHWFNNSGRSR